MQMISHGFVSGAMFLCIGVLYDRMHTRQIADYGGVVNTMPRFAAFFMLFSLANAGLPATSGFVGEFMVILAAVQFNFWIGVLAGTTLILGAAYTLWMVKRVVFGAVANKHVAELQDLNGREFLMLGVLAIAVIVDGRLSGADRRCAADLGVRPAQACRGQQGALRCCAKLTHHCNSRSSVARKGQVTGRMHAIGTRLATNLAQSKRKP